MPVPQPVPTPRLRLTSEQIEYAISSVLEWLPYIGHEGDLPESVQKSALLRRLLSGFDPLPEAPPLSYGQPNYKAIEHGVWDASVGGLFEPTASIRFKHLIVDGEPWRFVSEGEPQDGRVTFYARYEVGSPLFQFTWKRDTPAEQIWSGKLMKTT